MEFLGTAITLNVSLMLLDLLSFGMGPQVLEVFREIYYPFHLISDIGECVTKY